MAYINKSEVDFLENLYGRIKDKKKFREETEQLKQIIFNLDERDYRNREKTRLVVNERRKKDPCYGRSQEEKEKIRKRKDSEE